MGIIYGYDFIIYVLILPLFLKELFLYVEFYYGGYIIPAH